MSGGDQHLHAEIRTPCHPRFAELQRCEEDLHRSTALRLILKLDAVGQETPEEFRQRFANAIHQAFADAYMNKRIDRATARIMLRTIAGRILRVAGYS